MTRGRAAILVLGLAFFSGGCARPGAAGHPSAADSAAAVAFAPSVNAFGCELYRALTETTSGNITLSPFGLSTCLGMACAGAGGPTRDEMQGVLHVSGDFADGYRDLRESIAARPTGQLAITNRIFVQAGRHVSRSYARILREQFGSSAGTIDFVADPEAGRTEVNRWFAEQTRGRIVEAFPAGSIDATTFAVLGNAVYFAGKWKEPFEKSATSAEPFHPSADSTITVQMMHRFGTCAFARIPEARMVDLDYEKGSVSFIVIVPDSVDGLSDLERRLTADSLRTWCSGLARREVDLALPRFTARSASMLAGTLEALGMETVFSPQADFTGIAAQKPLFLGAVTHQAYVQVDEEGTVAAAATGAAIATTATVESMIEVVRVDHPFLFAIRDRRTGCLLFLGRCVTI